MAVKFTIPKKRTLDTLINALEVPTQEGNTVDTLIRIGKIKQTLREGFEAGSVVMDQDDFDFLKGRFKAVTTWSANDATIEAVPEANQLLDSVTEMGIQKKKASGE